MGGEPHRSPGVANGDIEAHHEEILRRLGDLVAALEGGLREEIPRRFELLCEYVVARFDYEERAMAASAFPGTNVHRAAHARFVRDYAELRALYDATGPSLAVAVKTETWVRGWLEGHLVGADRAFARYVRAAGG